MMSSPVPGTCFYTITKKEFHASVALRFGRENIQGWIYAVEEERNSALQTLTSEACCLCHSNILPKPKLFPFISSLLSSFHLPSIQLLSSYPPYSTLISCVLFYLFLWNTELTF
ncbi:hypothetical protein S83_045751 [Arachis hypogaea]